jgi:hypothetical protein
MFATSKWQFFAEGNALTSARLFLRDNNECRCGVAAHLDSAENLESAQASDARHTRKQAAPRLLFVGAHHTPPDA